MRKRLVKLPIALGLCAVVFSFCSNAQRWQAGIQLGGTNYYGELQEKGFDLSQMRFMFGIAGAWHLNSRLSIQASV